MLKGGYKIVDLNNIELTDTAFLFTGLYNKLVENQNKTILLSNININFEPFNDYFVQPVVVGGNVLCTIGDYTLTITPDDYVYVEEGIVGGGGSGGGTYTAGEGINIDESNEISCTYNVKLPLENGAEWSLVTTGEKYQYINKATIGDIKLIFTDDVMDAFLDLAVGQSQTFDNQTVQTPYITVNTFNLKGNNDDIVPVILSLNWYDSTPMNIYFLKQTLLTTTGGLQISDIGTGFEVTITNKVFAVAIRFENIATVRSIKITRII